MAPSKLRNAIGLVKDQTSIGFAKISNTSPSLSDLQVAIVKATRHGEYPAEDKHIRVIISLTCYSRARVSSCVKLIARRLSKTTSFAVALKALMLVHCLLDEGDRAYEQEVFFTSIRGTRLLNMFDFCDTASRSNSFDYSGFVRTYALFLDEMLENRMQAKKGKHNSSSYREDKDESKTVDSMVAQTTPISEMETEQIFPRIDRLVQIIDRFLACRPTGEARTHRLVLVALSSVVKESFQVYIDVMEMLCVLFERFMNLDIPESVKVHEIFCKCSKKLDEIDLFYSWTKSMGIVRTLEYPEVRHISPKKLEVMDEFIRERREMIRNRKLRRDDEEEEIDYEEIKNDDEEDFNSVKALPPPEETGSPERKEEEVVKVEEEKKTQDMGDLLNLGEDAPTENEQADRLALALFDGPPTTSKTTGPGPWEAFADSSDWESKLVQTSSHLSNQNATLPRGFNTLVLDGMYQKGAINNQSLMASGCATGSASSVAFGSAGRPAMLALPAPQGQNGVNNGFVTDPFAASLSIAPPPYVQMSEMEKKQRFLVEEQLLWQQYSNNGMQGQMTFAHMQPNYHYSYNGGS